MASHAFPASHIIDDDDAPATTPARSLKPSLLRRFYDALIESQMRRAQREIDRKLGPGAYRRALRVEMPPER